MTELDWKTNEFERERSRLRAVAYRMLGSTTDAEDAVQEAWLRLSRADSGSVDNLAGWLTTVVARVCIDMLRTRRSRSEHDIETWLPEPVVSVDDQADPENEALIADSVGIALLVVLETLSPPERLAFVLHDMFAMPFDEIAPIIGRSTDGTRQLASRARRRVRGATPQTDPDLREQRRVVDAFLAAARSGDFEGLLAVLDPEVVFRADRGRLAVAGARPVVSGAVAVAEQVLARAPRFARFARPATVNGAAGLIVVPHDRAIAVIGFTMAQERIVEIDLVADPDKLGGVTAAITRSG
jgi:RNA polymerase sigma-70 factor (ECF subfamily)